MEDKWSKGFVEHLRTVHFAMVTLCITLVVVTTSATPFDYFKIRDQLSTLQKIKDASLQIIWDYKRPVTVPDNNENDRLNCASLIGRITDTNDGKAREHDCREFYFKALVVTIGDEEFGVDMDPVKAMDIADFMEGRKKADLTQLNHFEPIWKRLDEN